MNQGKLQVFKQEMARVNINILGISELRWTGMGEFNSGLGLYPDRALTLRKKCVFHHGDLPASHAALLRGRGRL